MMLKIFAVSAIVFGIAVADTPADCRFDDIQGTWIFYEGPRGNTKEIDCSNPNGLTNQYQLTLSYPNLVEDKNGNKGVWTLIYNEGFEVTVNGRRWFAFSNWTTDHGKTTSHCDQTNFGWAHDLDSKDWSCYYGKKQGMRSVRVSNAIPIDDLLDKFASQKFKTNNELIDQINAGQKLWTAKAYPEFEKYTVREVLNRMGLRKAPVHRPKPAPITPELQKIINDLPASWDWRNVSGVNYVSEVRDQGGCGSCYAFASTGLLESRYRIFVNNTNVLFSNQDIVDCSNYAQGCDGGFTYLIGGKYANDYGLVEEKCNPYTGVGHKKCGTDPSCKRYYAKNDYQYIGGYYGACNEALMRAALVNNGPIGVDFMAYMDFSFYQGGIYTHTHYSDEINGINWDPLQLCNHAVLAVGYGTDPQTNTDYWIVKNSWGPNWGEDGYFRIVRGTNECAIESAGQETNPVK